jgi:hypothetical protein
MRNAFILTGAALLLCSLSLVEAAAAAPTTRSTASIACSKEADAKGLHGKARKKFRSECKKASGRRARPRDQR